jgi:hypothetical protein
MTEEHHMRQRLGPVPHPGRDEHGPAVSTVQHSPRRGDHEQEKCHESSSSALRTRGLLESKSMIALDSSRRLVLPETYRDALLALVEFEPLYGVIRVPGLPGRWSLRPDGAPGA